MEEWDTEEQAGDSSAAVAGAATLLAAAAEVESREAAAAAAGTSTGYASPAQLGGGGVASHSHSPAGRALPDSPGGSATGSSLRPPPADASQQVQAFLQGFLQAAQATGASAPAPPAVAATGMPAAATGAAGQAAGQAAGTALPSFLTPQQLSSVRLCLGLAQSNRGGAWVGLWIGGKERAVGQGHLATTPLLTRVMHSHHHHVQVGQQAAVFRLLAALAASPNGHPM